MTTEQDDLISIINVPYLCSNIPSVCKSHTLEHILHTINFESRQAITNKLMLQGIQQSRLKAACRKSMVDKTI